MADTAWAHPELLCDTEWLSDHLDDPNVATVDCDQPPVEQRLFHLPSLRRRYLPHSVWRGEIVSWRPADARGVSRSITEPATFEELIGSLGIGHETRVVCCDRSGGMWATWFWGVLARFGHTSCQVLDGGLDKWRAEGRPLSRTHRRPDRTTYTASRHVDSTVCSLEDVAAAVGDTSHVFWDLRCTKEWTGDKLMGARRGGHIPGAVLLDWRETLASPLNTFKPPAELRHLLEQSGITPDKTVTTYCHGGVRAAHGYFVLCLLGYDKARLYDASWIEYSATEYPVELPAKG